MAQQHCPPASPSQELLERCLSPPPLSFSYSSPSFPSSRVSDLGKSKESSPEGNKAPTSVTLLFPLKLLSLLRTFGFFHLQLRVDSLLRLQLLPHHLSSHAPSPNHRACSHRFPSLAGWRQPSRRPTQAPHPFLGHCTEGQAGQFTNKARTRETLGELLCREAGLPHIWISATQVPAF